MAVFHAFWLLYTSWFNSKQRQIYPLMMIRRFQWFIKFFGTNLAKVTLLVILTIFYTWNVYVGLKRCQTELLANILFLLHLLYIYNMNCNLFSVMKIWKKTYVFIFHNTENEFHTNKCKRSCSRFSTSCRKMHKALYIVVYDMKYDSRANFDQLIKL